MQATGSAKNHQTRRAGWALAWVVLSAPVVVLLLRSPLAGWGAMLGYHAGCMLAARASGVDWGRRAGPREILAWAATTLVVLAGVSQALPQGAALLERAAPSLQRWGLQGWSGLAAFGWYIVVNPWIEEAFWRGTLLSASFESLVGRRTAGWIATLGFVPYHTAVIHLMFGGEAWWFSIAVALGSACWVWMSRWRRSVVPAAVSHQMADLFVVLLYLARSPAA